MSAIEMLEQEHALIMRVVKLLPIIRERVEKGQVDAEVLMTVVDFFQTYADKCHHAKEELGLFQSLARHGVRTKGCPVGTLHNEHDEGRILMKMLADAVRAHVNGDPQARTQVIEYLKTAADFYTDHIWKEDFLLFPMSHKVLSSSDEQNLEREFTAEDVKLGKNFQVEYEYHVNRLETILSGDGNIAHPWGPHTQAEDPVHVIQRLEGIMHIRNNDS